MNKITNHVIIEHIKRRIRNNKNALILVIGDTGSGKSYASLRLLKKINPTFNVDFVEFKPDKFVDLVNKNYPPMTCMLFDEVGVAMNARSWQSKFNKILSYVLQTFRFKNYIVMFTVPDLSFVDIHARKLFHYEMEAKNIDHSMKIAKFSFRYIQINRKTGKIYKKAIRYKQDDDVKLAPWIKLKLPSKPLIKKYEEKRADYIKGLYDGFKEEKPEKVKPKKEKKLKCVKCGHQWVTRIDNPMRCPRCTTLLATTTKLAQIT